MGRKLTAEEFIIRVTNIFGNIFDYSKCEFNGMKQEVILICKNHDTLVPFKVKPSNLLYGKHSCPVCSGHSLKVKDYDTFINKSKIVHNKYYYPKFKYINNRQIINIVCKKHGKFSAQIGAHLRGHGCPQCSGNKKLTCFEILTKCNEVHNNKFIYDINTLSSVSSNFKIICSEHGEFTQLGSNHIYLRQGCPKCSMSKGEQQIVNILEENNIIYTQQKRFDKCKNINTLPFDFYLNDLNILIEYDGIQHFKPVEFFGGEISFNLTQQNDNIKNNYCKENNVVLHRIRYDDNINQEIKKILQLKNNCDNK